MGQRLELQNLLEGLGGDDGPVKTYFQPPADNGMVFPCIVYDWDDAETEFAGNYPYRYTKRYQVTYISADPDDPIPDRIAMLPMCTFSRKYVVDRRHHTVFNLFF